MIQHIFFDKCNTIIENSELNTGLNPVAELNRGKTISRILIHFNLDALQKDIEKGIININDLQYKIKMTNCGSINLPIFQEKTFNDCAFKKRACSFDIIAFRLPREWDGGRGYDFFGDYAKETKKIVSTDGSNWFQSINGVEWDEYGVYSNQTLSDDYFYNYGVNDDALIIGRQHFDMGTEHLEIDITQYINNVLLGKFKNYGIGLAFSPKYEYEDGENTYISFFTTHTNTFFLPYLEVINKNTILDDRAHFCIGKQNRLYFFTSDNGEFINLDELPTCTINDTKYEVKQNGKGVYYIDILLSNKDFEPETILIDTWSNLKYNGEELDDVDLEFVLLPLNSSVNLGQYKRNDAKYHPQVFNINNKEYLQIGEIREVGVDFIEEYSYGKTIVPYESEFRLYVKDCDKEIDVFDYQIIERKYDKHSFIIDTNSLIPNRYYVDIKTKKGRDINYYKNVLEFNVVSDLTNLKK